MAGPVLWLVSVLGAGLLTHSAAGPLPHGTHLLVTTGPPDIWNPLDKMMGDAPQMAPPDIYSFNVYTDIQFRFARTLVTSKVFNREVVSQELSYSVVLPKNAFITGFLMESGNKTYQAYLTEKSTADAAYAGTVQSGKAGALLSYRDSNLFEINVNIESYQKVTFKLSYEELLERRNEFYHHVVTVNPGQVVPGMKVKVHIIEPRPITTVLTPKFSYNNIGVRACSGAIANSTCVSDNEQVKKTTFSPNEILLELGISQAEQKNIVLGSGRGLSGQFEVMYDVEHFTGGEVLVRDGYFIHFFAPPPAESQYIPKHIIFVLDVSGSMSGEKNSQVQSAMRNILKQLSPDDLLNVIVFADYVDTWGLDGQSDLRTEDENNGSPTARYHDILPAFPFTEQVNDTTLNRVNQMNANGGTNIYGALRQAVRTAQKRQSEYPNSTVPIIFFLTDGSANTGLTGDALINELSKLNTAPKVPIYSFSFGEGGDIDFLRKLSSRNNGVARSIYQGADADVQLQGVYREISHAVLTNVTFRYLPEEVDLSSITKMNYHTFFEGAEFVVTGRLIDEKRKKIFSEVSAQGRGMQTKTFQGEAYEDLQPVHTVNASLISVADPTVTHKAGSIERAWAYLTIKQLVEKAKVDLPAQAALQQRATDLAKKYSFASEVTTLVVVKPDGQTQKADVSRIVVPEGEDAAQPSAQPFTAKPDSPSGTPVNITNFPTLLSFARKKPKSKALRLYDIGYELDDVNWLPNTAKKYGYVALMNNNGTFNRYTILYDPEQLDRADEQDCNVGGYQGKCRHLSQCVMREIQDDYVKYRDHFQCELNNYLAICCPH